ncbi:hypothetical protein K501DRAFT_328817 [Backusella circina FSU 941]|nr:hypothetical protein K501DRAFT_328817 [Backusella circina FSU 941]
MTFYYSYSPATQLIQTPDNEPLDERWNILDNVSTKPSSSLERCNTFSKYQEYHQDTKSEEDETMMICHQYSPLSNDISPDFLSSYFREEMDNWEIPQIIVEEQPQESDNDYFDIAITNNMEQDEADDSTSDDDDDGDDITDETIPLEQTPPPTRPEDDKYTSPTSILEYHQNLAAYCRSCIMKQISENELAEGIHNLSIL